MRNRAIALLIMQTNPDFLNVYLFFQISHAETRHVQHVIQHEVSISVW